MISSKLIGCLDTEYLIFHGLPNKWNKLSSTLEILPPYYPEELIAQSLLGRNYFLPLLSHYQLITFLFNEMLVRQL